MDLNSNAIETSPSCLYVFGDFYQHFATLYLNYLQSSLRYVFYFSNWMLLNSSLHGGGSSSKRTQKWITDAETWYFSHFGSPDKKKNSSRDDRLMTTSECQLKQDREFSPRPFAVPPYSPFGESLGLIRSGGSFSPPSPYLWERHPDLCLIRYSLLVVRAARWRDRLWMAESVIPAAEVPIG